MRTLLVLLSLVAFFCPSVTQAQCPGGSCGTVYYSPQMSPGVARAVAAPHGQIIVVLPDASADVLINGLPTKSTGIVRSYYTEKSEVVIFLFKVTVGGKSKEYEATFVPGTTLKYVIPEKDFNIVCKVPTTPTAMDRVNAKRATRGLRPFIEDPILSKAAQANAEWRAANRIYGHSRDFDWLPSGSGCRTAGCEGYACWDTYTTQLFGGWGSCCDDENWTYAGAGFVEKDGHCYMQLLVR